MHTEFLSKSLREDIAEAGGIVLTLILCEDVGWIYLIGDRD
jgi:hypothetical protein